MSDPVMAADGHSYERTAIERWLATKSTSPLTGGELDHTCIFPNHSLRRMIREWQKAQAVECTELSASPSSRESLRRLQWCACVSASARQSRAQ
ncbi:hypothetical protein EMIHUDRAFT_204711 [Emiliania huxleyi CCMP1516]|uniref:U-box domain-containing protein n=2 Tax=Emiliania huxleyi TaxID=2903 RepID=A0A0D3JW74_EMIH1|nr:hypothetical protein EMIHUDRAFT_204711 [Emiliania huxleyi CCMP1516]EOD27759.1 hypothetical protein EMIHUDRAFT_204711 [Emiliania huxleyi CCMP1516]|eukprot:XP_005780188.1 hypothetical protein EMIHUDRAFT_204711 [Emiliania huxleyi CCMP1516]